MGKLANAGSHHASNPAADYAVINWYSRPWNAVLRPSNKELAELSANMAIAAANNNHIIYIWGGLTYHKELAKVNYDPSAIKVSCGTDCMGTCYANIKGAMKRLGLDTKGIPDLGTATADSLLKVGYKKYTDSDHIRSDAHAQRGDVYVNYGLHAAMHVGDGNLDGYSTGTDTGIGGGVGGTGVNINIEAMSPYVIGIPESDTSFDAGKFFQSQVSGVLLHAGYLYTKAGHLEMSSYIAPNLLSQYKCCQDNKMPFALLAEVRARSVAEAQKECANLYYVCAACVPEMSLWLHLDMNNSVATNERILDYYIEETAKWGFKDTLGIYVTKNELKQITWNKYSKKLFLWRVDHSADIDNYVGVLPFSVTNTTTVDMTTETTAAI